MFSPSGCLPYFMLQTYFFAEISKITDFLPPPGMFLKLYFSLKYTMTLLKVRRVDTCRLFERYLTYHGFK